MIDGYLNCEKYSNIILWIFWKNLADLYTRLSEKPFNLNAVKIQARYKDIQEEGFYEYILAEKIIVKAKKL